MLTNIYHITYTPEIKEAELFFWGCNMDCRGCLCKKEIWDFLIKETMLSKLEVQSGTHSKPPKRFLQFDEVMQILGKLDVKQITMGGMEPTMDPIFPLLTKTLHDKFRCFNVVFTNLYEIPSLEDTDLVVFGLNAVTDTLHQDYTGKSNHKILENFGKVYQSGKKVSVSTPLIPGYIGNKEIENIARYIAGIDRNIPYFIRPFFKAGDNPWRQPTHEEMDEVVGIARKHLAKVNFLYGDESLKFEVFTIFPESAALAEILGQTLN